MHAYASYGNHVRVYGLLAVVSVVSAWTLYWLSGLVALPQWLISVPSVAGVFGLLYVAFDRWAWKWKVSRLLGLSPTPDLSGSYDGELTSTYRSTEDGEYFKVAIEIEVVQSWSKLAVTLSVKRGTSTSRSISAMAAMTQHGEATRLVYVYRNQVSPGIADEDMRDHEGMADVVITRDGRLEGRYFNSRPRSGSLLAQRRVA
ncbi:MAG: hypothetical protein ACFCUP_06475 [Actinomycetales bacterium]